MIKELGYRLWYCRAHLDKYKTNGIRSWGPTCEHIAQVVWDKHNGWVLQDIEEGDVFPLGAFDTVVGNEFQGILKEVDARVAV